MSEAAPDERKIVFGLHGVRLFSQTYDCHQERFREYEKQGLIELIYDWQPHLTNPNEFRLTEKGWAFIHGKPDPAAHYGAW